MSFRIEKDTLGELRVPSNKYWGANERSRSVPCDSSIEESGL